MNSELVVIGNISRDTACYPASTVKTFWGGAGLNIAVSAAQSGKKPKLISSVGKDANNLLLRIQDQIDISLIKIMAGKTCQFEIHYTKSGILKSIICNYGVATSLNLHLQKIKLPPAHYHISCRQPLNPELILQRVLRESFTFSLDFILSSIREQLGQIKKWIPYAKYLFVNNQEFKILKELLDPKKIQTLIVTSSNQPLKVFNHGQEVVCYSCYEKEFRDVTGAGDAFIGSFLVNQLEGEELFKSVEKAIIGTLRSLDMLGVINLTANRD